MNIALRSLLVIYGAWLLFESWVLLVNSRRTATHLSDAPAKVRRTLRARVIGGYCGVAGNLAVAGVLVVGVAGDARVIEGLGPGLIVVFVVVSVGTLFGVKAVFGSMHDPLIAEFDSRYVKRPFTRGRAE